MAENDPATILQVQDFIVLVMDTRQTDVMAISTTAENKEQ